VSLLIIVSFVRVEVLLYAVCGLVGCGSACIRGSLSFVRSISFIIRAESNKYLFCNLILLAICTLLSSGQIQVSGFDFRRYQIFREIVGLERGPVSLVSTTEELLDRKVAAPV
jgi:hypothetical protein